MQRYVSQDPSGLQSSGGVLAGHTQHIYFHDAGSASADGGSEVRCGWWVSAALQQEAEEAGSPVGHGMIKR